MSQTSAVRTREKVVLVGVVLPETPRSVVDEHLDELEKLVEAAGGSVVAKVLQERKSPDPAMYIGRGKAESIEAIVKDTHAGLIVFDDDLSPAQSKNLEKMIPAKVIDRSALILDIFARRARSRESRTQVELAQLSYLLPRLTRQWSHLSRQAGGIGTRGVGETQLELDRRIIRTRIARLKEDLKKIEQTRETQRKHREGAYSVALVGYTNAGKSTLFNRLTEGEAEAVNKLFVTLDAKRQKMSSPMPRPTVVIDTVGFIRKLPHHLVASFRSTMEEAVSADLVLHVIDLADVQVDEQREVGRGVLKDLGVQSERIIDVYNKVDQVEGGIFPISRTSLTVSALTGKGIGSLIDLIRDRQLAGGQTLLLKIPHGESRLIAQLHELGVVQEQKAADTGTLVVAWIPNDSTHLFENFVTDEAGLKVMAGN